MTGRLNFFFRMATSRHLGFDPTGNDAVRSALSVLGSRMGFSKSIGWCVAELWPFEVFHTLAGERTPDTYVILYSVQFCYAVHWTDNKLSCTFTAVVSLASYE